ncbi:MAG: hypothetical protein ACE5KF_01370, partial [Kiloniellaceae bacterium]
RRSAHVQSPRLDKLVQLDSAEHQLGEVGEPVITLQRRTFYNVAAYISSIRAILNLLGACRPGREGQGDARCRPYNGNDCPKFSHS